MGMLKNGGRLQAFAEKDPRIAYKKEGYRYFEEMMAGIRDKVTDLIFRARVGRAPEQPQRSRYRETAAVHETSNNYGVTENLRESGEVPVGAGVGGGSEMAQAAGETQGEAPKVKTI